MLKNILFSLLFIGTLLNATVPTEESVTKLYIASFDRAPDKAGLEYWLHKSGLHIEGIAMSFFDQKETKEKYPSGFSNADFIEAIYRNLFQRRADSSGFEYWHKELEAGTINSSVFILAIINGAKGDDAKILHNKTQVGLSFSRAGKSDVEEAYLIMIHVTAEEDTISSALCKYSLAGCLKPEEDDKIANKVPIATAQSKTMVENSKDNAITLAGTDADGDTLKYTIVTPPTHGKLIGTTPNMKYTPNADYDGTDSFTFKVYDGKVYSSSAKVSIIVTAVDEPNTIPLATTQTKTVIENSTDNTITLAGTDADGDDLTYIIVANPLHGTLGGTASNITYTPNADYDGTDSFTFKVNDGTVDSSSATVSITVTDVAEDSDAPIAVADTHTVEEDALISTISVLDNDTADGDTLSIASVTAPNHNGTATIDGTNIKYTPASNFNGTETFNYTVNDGTIDGNSVTVTVTVTAVNDAPIATSQSGQTYAEDSTNNTITLVGSDIDSNTLTYEIVDIPSHGTLNTSNLPNITYTPDANYAGEDSFTFKLNDSTLDSNIATVEFIVEGSNDTPIAESQAVEFTEDSGANNITLVGTDIDDDTLTYEIVDSPSHGTLDESSLPNITYTPTDNFNGEDSFTFKVNDGTVDSSSVTINITVDAVNDAPIATPQSSQTYAEDSIDNSITLAGLDIDGDDLTYEIVATPLHGTLDESNLPNITYTPTANYEGTDSFTFKINDGTVDSNIATVEFELIGSNDTPIAESQAVEFTEDSGANNITLVGTDIDGDTLTYEIVDSLSHGTLDESSLPNITYTPTDNFNGTDSFTFKVNDGTVDSSSATIDITVTAVNDAPIIISEAIIIATEDIAYSYSPTVTDEESDTITWIISGEPTTMTINSSTGAIAWTPLEGVTSSGEVTITATDNGSPNKTDTESFTIAVTQINDVPIIISTATTTATEDIEYTYTPEVTDAENNTITWTISNAPTGMTIDANTGAIAWTPLEGVITSNEITITATDDGEGALTDTEIFTIAVTAVNDNPIADAGDDQSEIVVGTDVDLDGLGSSDPDTSDTLYYLWSITSQPIDSEAALSETTVVSPSFTADKVGTYTISLIVNDETEDSVADSVTITTEGACIASSDTITDTDGVEYNEVCSPHTQKIWLDRNLGASEVCTAFDDTDCYGYYYQWGRNADGHQYNISSTTDVQATDLNDVGHVYFITADDNNDPDLDLDWAKALDSEGTLRNAKWSITDGTSICPIGYRVPTEAELNAETINADITNNNTAFTSFLKLPSAGYHANRTDDFMVSQGSWVFMWSSSVGTADTSQSFGFYFGLNEDGSDLVGFYSGGRADGLSVRCIKGEQ